MKKVLFLPDTDPDSIYLNTSTEINPLAVFGHELLHLIKVDNRKAYDALETVVKRNITAESQKSLQNVQIMLLN